MGGSQGVLLVVVDGMSSSPFGGSVARWVVEQHLATDKIAFEAGLAADHALRVYLRQLHEQFHEEFAGEGMEDTGFIAPK